VTRRLSLVCVLVATLAALLSTGATGRDARAAETHASAPAGLNLSVSPSLVDVGSAVMLTVSAKHFAPGTSVTVKFLSPHHGFSGKMGWTPQCSCFKLDVFLAKRSHGLEMARATALVTVGGKTFARTNRFQIRGLTPNGKRFSAGGTPYLAAWVSNPQPLQNESEHFCAWTRALDSFPITGMPVTFVVHYQSRKAKWFAGYTGTTGTACSSKNIFHAKVGYAVHVDVYAGHLHKQVIFTPRSG
jgi:hypothetical protein